MYHVLLAAGGLLMPGVGLAQEADAPAEATESKDGAPCEYEASGKKTWQEMVSGQCMPKRCLQDCARYGASLLAPDTPLVDGGEMLTVNLMHCAMSCWLNDVDDLPQAQSFDLPCRRYTEWPADDPQNWLQPGKACDSASQRACLYGQCLDSSGFVLQAVDGYISGAGEKWYLWKANGSTEKYAREARIHGYTEMARVVIGHTQVRPPGLLVRPDWKKVQRQDYERELVRRAKEQADAEAGRRIREQ